MKNRLGVAAAVVALALGGLALVSQGRVLAGPDAVPTQAPAAGRAAPAPAAGTPSPQGPALSSAGVGKPVVPASGPNTVLQGRPVIPARSGTSPSQAAFSEQDVRDYVAAHPPLHLAPGTPVTVQTVGFLPARLVAARLGDSFSRGDNDLLAFVTVRGSFHAGPPGQQGSYGTAYMVFDAHTGNFLAEGLS